MGVYELPRGLAGEGNVSRHEPSPDGALTFMKRLLSGVAVVTFVLLALLGA